MEIKRPDKASIRLPSLPAEKPKGAHSYASDTTFKKGYDPATGELARLAYTIQPDSPLHYKYEITSSFNRDRLIWSGHLAISAENPMQIRKPERLSGPNLRSHGQGLAIAPNRLVTGLEWVDEVESITVQHDNKSPNASKIGQVTVKSFPGVGLAILETENPIFDSTCYPSDLVNPDQVPIHAPLTIVYRNREGEIQTQKLSVAKVRSTRRHDNQSAIRHIHARSGNEPIRFPSGSVALSDSGQIVGIVAHVPDQALNSSIIVPLSEFERLGTFTTNSITTPTSTSPSVAFNELNQTLGPSLVQIEVNRIPTKLEQKADVLPSQVIRFQEGRNSPPTIPPLERLAYFGNENGEFQLMADGSILSGNANLLPLAIGTPCNMVMPPLDPVDDYQWEVSYPLYLIEDHLSRDRICHLRRSRTQLHSVGSVTRSFSSLRRDRPEVLIKEEFRMESTIGVSMSGNAEYLFDADGRSMKQGEFKGSFMIDSKPGSNSGTLHYSFERLTPEQYEQFVASERTRESELAQTRKEAQSQTQFAKDEIEQILTDLSHRQKRSQAIHQLASKQPNEIDPRISAKLKQLLLDPRMSSGVGAAASKWITDDDFLDLVDDMHKMDPTQKQNVYRIAAERKMEFAVSQLIPKIEVFSYSQAKAYLTSLDESRDIEELIQQRIRTILDEQANQETMTLRCLVESLGEKHGSVLSIPIIKEVSSSHQDLGPQASDAIEQIEFRKQ